jgi:hypothetical protein
VRGILKEVNLFHDLFITAEIVATLLRNCYNIEQIDIRDCKNFSATELLKLLSHDNPKTLAPLKKLSLSPNSSFHRLKDVTRSDSIAWMNALMKIGLMFSPRCPDFEIDVWSCRCGAHLADFW